MATLKGGVEDEVMAALHVVENTHKPLRMLVVLFPYHPQLFGTQVHNLRADLSIISSERDVMKQSLTEVHSVAGIITERLEETMNAQFYEFFKWLWMCTAPDLGLAATGCAAHSKKSDLIDG